MKPVPTPIVNGWVVGCHWWGEEGEKASSQWQCGGRDQTATHSRGLLRYNLTNTNGRETKSDNRPPLAAAEVLVFLCGKHFKTL